MLYEAELLAPAPAPAIDLYKPAGPATCLLVSIDDGYLASVNQVTVLPAYVIGWME